MLQYAWLEHRGIRLELRLPSPLPRPDRGETVKKWNVALQTRQQRRRERGTLRVLLDRGHLAPYLLEP